MKSTARTLRTVAVYSLNHWESVLPILRIVGPAQQAGLQVIRGNEHEDISPEKVSIADAVIIQRNFPRHVEAYEEIVARAHAEKKPVIFELDDLLLELPEWHPAKAMPEYKNAQVSILRAIVEADAVTASTPALCAYLRQFNRNTWLLANYLNDNLWTMGNGQSNGSPVVIGYIGGSTHALDLEIVTPTLVDVLKRYGNNVAIWFWGCEPPSDFAKLTNVEWIPLNLVSYSEFALYCSKLKCDVLIAPLRDNVFNRCKSQIKFLEYGTLGIPGVYSRITPYESIVSHGKDGFLASTQDEWKHYLDQLIESHELRNRMGQDAQKTVHDRWLLSQHANEWREVYQKAGALVNKPVRKSGLTDVAQLAQIWQRELEAEIKQKEQVVTALSERLEASGQVIQELQEQFAGIEGTSQSLGAQLTEKEKLTQELGNQAAEKELLVLALHEKIAEMERTSQSLGAQLTEKEKLTQELGNQIAEKEKLTQELGSQIAEKERLVLALHEKIADLEKSVVELNTQVRAMTSSTGWALLQVIWRIRIRVAPRGSRRERILRSAMRELRSLGDKRLIDYRREVRAGILSRGRKESADSVGYIKKISGLFKQWGWRVYAIARPTARDVLPFHWRAHIRESFRRYAGPEPGKPVSLAPLEAYSKTDSMTVGLPTCYDVICFPIIDWEHRFQRPQQLATLFAQHGHRVFYLNLTFHDRGSEAMVREVAERVYQVQLPGPQDFDRFFKSLPQDATRNCLAALESLFLQAMITDAVCMVEIPFWTELALGLRERHGWKVIYDCMDEQVGLTILDPDLVPRETELAREANLVTVSSQKLLEKHIGKTAQLLLLRNATDFKHFNQPSDDHPLDHLAHPLIGYYGAIMDWFDSEMLAEIAVSRPNWNLVLIGNVDTAVGVLRRLANVHFLGEQPYSRLPAYMQQFDVCLIPFKLTPIIQATNPVKFYEYLSAGKPVVSAPLPDLAALTDLYYPATGSREFIAQIERALLENSSIERAKRIEWARQQTWQTRFELLTSKIHDIYGLASIIIVSYNNRAKIQACLESIARKTFYPRYEVIIVDNGSTIDVAEYLQAVERTDARIRVIQNGENFGFARAVNIGLDAMSKDSEYIVLLNNDTVVTPGWLSTLAHWLRDPAIGLAGPVTCPSGAANEAAIPVGYDDLDELDSFATRYTAQHRGACFDIPMLAMYCLGMRRQVYEEIGPLDEQFETGMFEDDDYSLRVRNKGYRVICAEDVFIHHSGRASFSLLDDQEYRALFSENRRRFEEKWRTKWKMHAARRSR